MCLSLPPLTRPSFVLPAQAGIQEGVADATRLGRTQPIAEGSPVRRRGGMGRLCVMAGRFFASLRMTARVGQIYFGIV